MEMIEIFGLQFVLSVTVVALIARWYVGPWLDRLSLPEALFWLSVPHAFRHLGLVFLVPGIVSPSLASSFSVAAAYGDLAAGLLGIAAMIALRQRWTVMFPIVWLLNIVGFADLVNALRQADVIPHLEAAWYIPTFVVPVLLVTHVMMFRRLIAMSGTARKSEGVR